MNNIIIIFYISLSGGRFRDYNQVGGEKGKKNIYIYMYILSILFFSS